MTTISSTQSVMRITLDEYKKRFENIDWSSNHKDSIASKKSNVNTIDTIEEDIDKKQIKELGEVLKACEGNCTCASKETNKQWITYGKSWGDFQKERLNQLGTLIDTGKDGYWLLGDCDSSGYYGCGCSLPDYLIVEQYLPLISQEELDDLLKEER